MEGENLFEQELARRCLIDFVTYTKPDFEVSAHHRLIAEHLEAVERGEIDRLMIFAPPRHTKSELASRRFPAWYVGRNPSKQLICAAYGGDLASDFGYDVRPLLGTTSKHSREAIWQKAESPNNRSRRSRPASATSIFGIRISPGLGSR